MRTMYAEIKIGGTIWKKRFITNIQAQLDTHGKWGLDVGGVLFIPKSFTALSFPSNSLKDARVVFSNDEIESKTLSAERKQQLEQTLRENKWNADS